jgi:hypothetical protein
VVEYRPSLDAYVGKTSDGRTVTVDSGEVAEAVVRAARLEGVNFAALPDEKRVQAYERYKALVLVADNWADLDTRNPHVHTTPPRQ